MSDLHPTAAAGFAAAADRYERHRPGYPQEAVDAMTAGLDLQPDRVVLDLAAGTGKLTRHLVATGANVIAVEPVEPMRRVLTDNLPTVAALDGTAESLPLPDEVLDAAAVGQAFHWFDASRALAELQRTLRPEGRAAIVFNRRAVETPLQAAIAELLAPYRGDTPSWTDDAWQASITDAPGFETQGPRRFPHAQRVDADGLVGRVMSVSFVAMLDDAARAALLTGLRDIFEREQRDGHVSLDYDTWVWILQRRT